MLVRFHQICNRFSAISLLHDIRFTVNLTLSMLGKISADEILKIWMNLLNFGYHIDLKYSHFLLFIFSSTSPFYYQ